MEGYRLLKKHSACIESKRKWQQWDQRAENRGRHQGRPNSSWAACIPKETPSWPIWIGTAPGIGRRKTTYREQYAGHVAIIQAAGGYWNGCKGIPPRSDWARRARRVVPHSHSILSETYLLHRSTGRRSAAECRKISDGSPGYYDDSKHLHPYIRGNGSSGSGIGAKSCQEATPKEKYLIGICAAFVHVIVQICFNLLVSA